MHVASRGNFSSQLRSTDLVKVSKDAASLLVCTRKKFFAWGSGFFVSDVISGGLLGHPGPGRQPLVGSISLKFSLETRLQSESFDTLDDLLGFRVQKL